MNPDSPRRWLLVRREAGISVAEGAGDRWAVDHLFLDQDAVPTLVEVKRRGDTRIRREVVGQMLDYAANAVVHWPAARIQATYEAECEARGDDAEALLGEFLGAGGNPLAFWAAVKTNLQAGRIRVVFISDAAPLAQRGNEADVSAPVTKEHAPPSHGTRTHAAPAARAGRAPRAPLGRRQRRPRRRHGCGRRRRALHP